MEMDNTFRVSTSSCFTLSPLEYQCYNLAEGVPFEIKNEICHGRPNSKVYNMSFLGRSGNSSCIP